MGCLKTIGYLVLAVAVAIPLLIYYAAHYTLLSGMVPILTTDFTPLSKPGGMPDLTGKTIVVTGANTGLGFATAKHIAAAGANTIITCRSAKKCDPAVERIKAAVPSATISYGLMDLGSLASVQG